MFAVLSDRTGTRASDFVGGDLWLNSPPIEISQLRGRVVLVNFFTYSCANCLRTLPHFRRWHEWYGDRGLTIVGVHTPEFEFEREPRNVIGFVRRSGIRFPVVLDNEREIWHAYGNRYWPHWYLVDGRGVIRYHHEGEGAYHETEAILRTLLSERNPDLDLPPFRPNGDWEAETICLPASPDLYCGFFQGALGNVVDLARDTVTTYEDPGIYESGCFYLDGVWEMRTEYVRHARVTDSPVDSLGFRYQAFEVDAVLGNLGEEPVLVEIRQDERPLPPSVAGRDVQYRDGRSYVEVVEPRLYNLVADTHFGAHDLHLLTASDQLAVYELNFSGCPHDVVESP